MSGAGVETGVEMGGELDEERVCEEAICGDGLERVDIEDGRKGEVADWVLEG